MTTHTRTGAALALVCFLAACTSAPTYHVTRIIDGDTIEITDAGGIRTRVRLRRVNAPEMDEPGGPEARDALVQKYARRRVFVTPYARDRYGRLVADVSLNRRGVTAQRGGKPSPTGERAVP